jgi:trans-aconitate 2-methyltransferase
VTQPSSPRWDPAQYDRYAAERGRPFVDLIARIAVESPRVVVDLGCGPGALTETLSERWPQARVLGVDSSPDMIAAAEPLGRTGRLEFRRGDVGSYRPDSPVDVVTANAVFQWVPGHLSLIPDIASWLAPGGVLAFQVPDNFSDPSHTLLRDLRLSQRWRDRVGDGADRELAVERPKRYLEVLAAAGLEPDVWATTYLHLLPGADPVLEWMKGTALRPVLSTLADDPAATAAFLGELAAMLAAAYPAGRHGTVFPFRRTFAVARVPTYGP